MAREEMRRRTKPHPGALVADVERVVQFVPVVGSNVQGDWETVRGVDSGACGVQGKLADLSTEAIGC